MSSIVQFKDLTRLLVVYKSIQEALYAGETVLVFPKEATDAAVIAMVPKFHNPNSVNLAGCFKVTDTEVKVLAERRPGLESVDLWWCARTLFQCTVSLVFAANSLWGGENERLGK